ncbi:hypothetical protein ACO0LG_22300 [Undibacterium sp. Ji42W]|uniref:hypothetical protein n=1 Tax=Undibacterium sp. Ji42W TaxID=3413039 RepID=UPI003BF01038
MAIVQNAGAYLLFMVLGGGAVVSVAAIAVLIVVTAGIAIIFTIAGDGPYSSARDIHGGANDGTADFNGSRDGGISNRNHGAAVE